MKAKLKSKNSNQLFIAIDTDEDNVIDINTKEGLEESISEYIADGRGGIDADNIDIYLVGKKVDLSIGATIHP